MAGLLGLVVLSAGIYHAVGTFGVQAGWDDPTFVFDRSELRDWWAASWRQRLLTPRIGYPMPVPTFLHYLVGRLPEPWMVGIAHLMNLVFHLINVCLAGLLARRLLGSAGAALAVAALWAAHPLLVESVAWLTNLKTVTFATFFLGATLVWLRHLRQPGLLSAAGVVGLYILALGCRPEAVVAGPFWAVLAALRGRERLGQRLVWGPIAACVLVALVYVPVAQMGHQRLIESDPSHQLLQVSILERLTRMSTALFLQLRHVVWPIDLQPSYLPDQIASMGCSIKWRRAA